MSELNDSQGTKEEAKPPEAVLAAEQPKESAPPQPDAQPLAEPPKVEPVKEEAKPEAKQEEKPPEAPKEEAKQEKKASGGPNLPPNAAEQVGCIVYGSQLNRGFWTNQAKQEGFVVVDRGDFAQLHRDNSKKQGEAKPKPTEPKKQEYKKPA